MPGRLYLVLHPSRPLVHTLARTLISYIFSPHLELNPAHPPPLLLRLALYSQPFPALTQCYKFNQLSCCLSGHDNTIKENYSALLSVECLREFPPLEYFFCLGCHDSQMNFVDVDNKQVHVCPSFAKNFGIIWTMIDGLRLGSDVWPHQTMGGVQ